MAKAAAQRYPVYTTAKANLSALTSGSVEDQLRDGRRRPGRGRHQCRYAATGSGPAFGQYGPLGGENPVGFTPNGVSDTLEPAEPVVANPGTVNSDGSPNKPNVGIGFAAGTGGGYGPEGVNGSRVFLPFGLDPETHPGDGQLRREHRRRQGHLGLVRAAAAHPGPAAGHRRRRRRDLVLRRGGHVQLRPVAQAAVGRAPSRRQLSRRSAQVQPIDIFAQKAWRNLRFPLAWAPPEANVARIVADDPNLSDDQWFGFTPPRVPVLQTAQQFLGSQTPVLMDIATAANFPCQRPFSEHLGVAELPEYRILPNLKQMVVSSNQWQSAARRWSVPVHPGTAAHVDDPDLSARRLVPRLGCDRALHPGGARRARRPTPSSIRARRRCSAGAAADRSGRCHDRRRSRTNAPRLRTRTSRSPAGWRSIAGLIGFVLSVADAAAAGGADHRDAELAAGRAARATSPHR